MAAESTNYEKGLVSVIIPTFNRFDLLQVTIQSVLAQTYPHVEIIVIDDCSTDARYLNGQLEKFPRTTVIHLPVNMRTKFGVHAAQGKTRDEGIRIARGEWIAFVDDDDGWLPEKLERQLEALNEKNVQMSCTNYYLGNGPYNPDTPHRGTPFTKIAPNLLQVWKRNHIAEHNLVANSSAVIHHSVVDQVGAFSTGKAEDWRYWKRAMKLTDCVYVSDPLFYYNLTSSKFYIPHGEPDKSVDFD